jgi:hypothetical protein
VAEHWLQTLELVPSGSLTDEQQVGFIAWGFERTERDPDPQEVLQVRRTRFADALEMALRGQIRDAGTVALLTSTAVKRGAPRLPPQLVRRVVGRMKPRS